MRRIAIVTIVGLFAFSGVAGAGTVDADIKLTGGCGLADLNYLGLDLNLPVTTKSFKDMTNNFVETNVKSANKVGKSLKKAKTKAQRTAGVKKAYKYCVDNGLLEPDDS
jgi:hypothetical protein